MTAPVSRLRGVALPLAARIAAAVLGGYLLASAALIACGWLAPDSWRARIVMSLSLSSFALYTGAAVWAFAARSAWRAWVGLLAPAGALLAVAALWRAAQGVWLTMAVLAMPGVLS